jgi:hypothetical protein
MPKNLYYQKAFRRQNVIGDIFLGFFLAFCSYPRMVLEVFIRRNFGERYFSLFAAGVIALILALVPILMNSKDLLRLINGYDNGLYIFEFLFYNWTWYIFLAGFIHMCIQRNREVQRLPSVFDFARFSLSRGEIHPKFLEFKINGKIQDKRIIETLIEPGFFFIIGVVLWLLQQPVGLVILVCSVFYSFGYLGAYYVGDNMIMDKIDQMICNEEMVSSFIDGKDSSETRGVNYYGRRPADQDIRRRVADTFLEDEDILQVR